MQSPRLTRDELSRYRQSVRRLVGRIDHLASRTLFADPLIQGSPAEVYRRCGRPGCKCATGAENRHGPYKVIQMVRDGRSRQVCLRRSQEELWELARHYQFQSRKHAELAQTCRELEDLVWEIVKKRIVPFPEQP